MRRWLGHWRLLAAGLVVLAVLAAALWPDPIDVDLARAARGPLEITVDEEGRTRVREQFVVSAPMAGRLQRIDLEPGAAVVRGETVLARITPAAPPLLDARTRAELTAAVRAATATVGQARAERERAAAALERARSSVARQQQLAEAGAISRDELEAAQTALRAAEEARRGAEFGASRAEYELQLARVRLQQPQSGGAPVEIVAPIDGTVLERLRESEAVVQAGEPLLELGDPSRLEIVADLLSPDAVRVPPGARVLIEQWGGDAPLEGRIRLVEPSGFTKISALGVEEQRVNAIIDFADPAAAKPLGDAYRVEVRIVVWSAPDVLKIPVGSLFRVGEDWAVFAVAGGRAERRIVKIGHRNPEEAEVLEGLEAGQTIVLHPPDTLAGGARVAPRAGA
ncbi:MAG: efflux RND transporter periplasmic adaptor subunit [Acidobacteria bacterium]|nr:efflux RND transporter periplasmic adaptor subunit [Acidobacteriota bacterium]